MDSTKRAQVGNTPSQSTSGAPRSGTLSNARAVVGSAGSPSTLPGTPSITNTIRDRSLPGSSISQAHETMISGRGVDSSRVSQNSLPGSAVSRGNTVRDRSLPGTSGRPR